MRSRILRAVCLLLALVPLAGCGDGGKKGGVGTTQTPAVYGAQTVILAANDDRKITGTTDDSVTLSGDTSDIHVGSVIASSQGQGLLRKVIGMTPSASGMTYTTEQATLEDAVQQAEGKKNFSLGRAQVASFVPADSTVTLEGGVPGRALSQGSDDDAIAGSRAVGGSITLDLAKKEIYKSDKGEVAVSGKVKFSIEVGVDYDIDLFKIKRLGFDAVVTGKASAEFEANITVSDEKKVLLGKVIYSSVPIFTGFVVTPIFDVYAVVKGTAKAGFTLEIEAEATTKANVLYDNGEWTTGASGDHKIDLIPKLNFASSVELAYTPAHCELTLLVDGVVGPTFAVDPSTLKGVIKRQTAPDGLDFKVSNVSHASIGIKVAPFGYSLFDPPPFDIPVELEAIFYHRFFAFDSSGGVTIK